jgi:ketosteroid isomerase-like protein
MTQENVELVRRAYEELQAGLERGDPGAIFDLEFVADDYEWIVTQPLEGRSVWRGREGVVEFLRVWAEQFDDWSFQVADLIDASDDRVVALMHQWRPERRAASRSSGIAASSPSCAMDA